MSCHKGAFKYYVIKELGGWVGQMMMFDDKVGGWGWLNDDVIKKYTRRLKMMELLQSQDQTQFLSSVSKLT